MEDALNVPRSRRGTLTLLALAAQLAATLAFFLPWLAISVGGRTAASASGLDLMTGTIRLHIPLLGELSRQSGSPAILLIVAAALVLTGIVSAVAFRRRAAAVGLLTSSLALLLIVSSVAYGIYAKLPVSDEQKGGLSRAARLIGQDFLHAGAGFGFWLALTALAASILFNRMALPVAWREELPGSIRPYVEPAPLAALFLGVSSGFPYAMIGATLTSRLAQEGIDKKSVTAFTLAFLVYNFKPAWAWIVDGIRLPLLGRLGQRVSWLIFAGLLVMAAVANLAMVDPSASLTRTAYAAVLVGLAGATFDIVIDAYRIEILKPEQLGVGSGMTQYGWRIGSVMAGALALVLAARIGWEAAYLACAGFALPAMVTGLIMGEPERHRDPSQRRGIASAIRSIYGPFVEFFSRRGAVLVLIFILIHKIGDTLGQLTVRLLFDDLGFTNDEIAIFDVGAGFWAYLVGIFVGGILYSKLGMKRSVLISLILMGVSNFSFALLAQAGHNVWGMAGAMVFENFASGIGGVTVVAYFSALCDLRFTAAQYALISAATSIVGRFITGTSAGALVESMGYVNYYLLTTVAAVPGILLFWLMMRAGLIDASVGTAGTEGEGDARRGGAPRGGEPDG